MDYRKIEKINTENKSVELLNIEAIPRRYHTAEAYADSIYIIAGDDSEGKKISKVEILNAKTNKIQFGEDIPTPRGMVSSVIADGKIYVMGGGQKEGYSNKVEIYDIKTNKWKEGTPMEIGKSTDIVYYNDYIYAIGGYNKNGALKDFQRYNIKKNNWEKLSDLPFPLSAHHSIVYDNKIYVFGDYYELDRCWVYDLNKQEWKIIFTRIISPFPEVTMGYLYMPSRHNAVVNIKNKIYVIGGNVTSVNSCLDYIQEINADEF